MRDPLTDHLAMPIRILLPVIVALVGGVAVMALSQRPEAQQPAAATTPAKPATSAAAPPAAPKGDVVLTVRGVDGGNAGATVTKLDFATIDKLGRAKVTLVEPFEKRKMTFTGIWMRDLLPVLGVPASASRISMRALDDYSVDLSVADLTKHGFLATRQDDELIPLSKGGPVRVLFDGSAPVAENTDNWIWSVNRFSVAR